MVFLILNSSYFSTTGFSLAFNIRYFFGFLDAIPVANYASFKNGGPSELERLDNRKNRTTRNSNKKMKNDMSLHLITFGSRTDQSKNGQNQTA